MWLRILLLSTLFLATNCQHSPQRRIAIIGGGVGAASAAYHITEELKHIDVSDIEITVIERSSQLGGRTHSVEIEGHTIEIGASIAYEGNHYVSKMANAAGLEKIEPGSDGKKVNAAGLFAIFNGEKFSFRTFQWDLLTLLNMIWQYGFSFWRYRADTTAMFKKFEALYSQQDAGQSHKTPEEFLQALGLYEYTQMNMKEYITDNLGGYGRFAADFVGGVNRVNYDQSNWDLNALAGLVSMLPATDNRVFTIKGGNQQIASQILKKVVNARILLNSTVQTIEQRNDENGHRFTLGITTTNCLEEEGTTGCTIEEEQFDAVIIATPLESSNIDFKDVELPVIPARKYQQTVTTIVKGRVASTFFGLPPHRFPYDQVMVSDQGATKVPFASLSKLASLAGSIQSLYKLFSPEPLPRAWLEILFEGGYQIVVNHTWSMPGAYPSFDAPEDFAPFELGDGLYYNNALENAASAMEMSAIAGRNSALLAVEYLTKGKRHSRFGLFKETNKDLA